MPALTGRIRTPQSPAQKAAQQTESGYRVALRTPGALKFYLAAAPARIGIAMTGLGIVWLVHGSSGSYAVAGAVTGGFAVAEAVGGPADPAMSQDDSRSSSCLSSGSGAGGPCLLATRASG